MREGPASKEDQERARERESEREKSKKIEERGEEKSKSPAVAAAAVAVAEEEEEEEGKKSLSLSSSFFFTSHEATRAFSLSTQASKRAAAAYPVSNGAPECNGGGGGGLGSYGGYGSYGSLLDTCCPRSSFSACALGGAAETCQWTDGCRGRGTPGEAAARERACGGDAARRATRASCEDPSLPVECLWLPSIPAASSPAPPPPPPSSPVSPSSSSSVSVGGSRRPWPFAPGNDSSSSSSPSSTAAAAAPAAERKSFGTSKALDALLPARSAVDAATSPSALFYSSSSNNILFLNEISGRRRIEEALRGGARRRGGGAVVVGGLGLGLSRHRLPSFPASARAALPGPLAGRR